MQRGAELKVMCWGVRSRVTTSALSPGIYHVYHALYLALNYGTQVWIPSAFKERVHNKGSCTSTKISHAYTYLPPSLPPSPVVIQYIQRCESEGLARLCLYLIPPTLLVPRAIKVVYLLCRFLLSIPYARPPHL
jgi:hypothetical protein